MANELGSDAEKIKDVSVPVAEAPAAEVSAESGVPADTGASDLSVDTGVASQESENAGYVSADSGVEKGVPAPSESSYDTGVALVSELEITDADNGVGTSIDPPAEAAQKAQPQEVATDQGAAYEQVATEPGASENSVASGAEIRKDGVEVIEHLEGEQYAEKIAEYITQNPDKLYNHLDAVNLNDQITLNSYSSGVELHQYVRDGDKPGQYFCYPGTTPESLAIKAEGIRHLERYEVTEAIQGVETTAAQFDEGIYEGVGGPGRGRQVILPSGWESKLRKIG